MADAPQVDDVLAMHEEELQDLDAQQQQQDGNEDAVVDEQEIGEEDAEADRDDEVIFNVGEHWRRGFDNSCRRIERNDPDFRSFCITIRVDDGRAVQLGRALLGNTALTELSVNFMERASFTVRGAQAFLGGVFGSRIKSLTLLGSEELPLEMSLLCARYLEKIMLRFPFGNTFASQLFESLLESKLLDYFSIQVSQMTPQVAQILSTYLRRSSVTNLEIIDSRDAAATLTIQTLYLLGVRRSQNIQNLYLNGIMRDMHALVTTVSTLGLLSITHINISLADVKLLAHGLSEANQLHTLSLSYCELDDEHMSVLSPVLGTHPTLESLTLEYNAFGDVGIASFVEQWRPESKIEDLVLERTAIGATGAVLLIKASANHSLCTLRLDYNWWIGMNGLKLIGEALPDAKIETLELGNVVKWVEYEDFTCDKAIKQYARRKAAGKAIIEGIRGNRHLLEFRLSESHLPSMAIDAVYLYTDANTLGRRAALANQHLLPCGIWCHFLAKERMTSSLMFLFLLELPSLVKVGSRQPQYLS